MVNYKSAHYSGNSGEAGQNFAFRSDQEGYFSAAKTLSNHMVTPQGPVMKRRGLQFIASCTDAEFMTDFKFSNGQEYLLVWYPGKLEIWYRDELQYTNNTDIPYVAGECKHIKTTQRMDTLIVCMENHQPLKIMRNGSHTDWTVEPLDLDYYPFDIFDDVANVTLAGSATSGTITLTASEAIFTSDWEQKRVRFLDGVVRIEDATLDGTARTTCSGVVEETLSGTGAEKFEEQAFSNHRGWSTTACFFNQRLWLTGAIPHGLYSSQVNLFFDFNDGEALADEGIAAMLDFNSVNHILDLVPRKNALQAYTDSGEVLIEGKFTPDDISAVQHTQLGISHIRPVVIDTKTIFIPRDGKRAMAFTFNLQEDAYDSQPLTTVAHHIISDPQDSCYLPAYLDTGGNYFMVVNGDGQIACLCLDMAKDVVGWSRFETDGLFKSVCVVDDSMYSLIERDGAVYLEKLTELDIHIDHFYYGTSETAKSTGWNSAATLANKTVQCIATIDFNDPDIDNQDISNAFEHTEITLDGSGDFTLDWDANAIALGLPYESEWVPMDFAYMIQGVLVRGEPMRKVRAWVNLKDTKDLTVDGRFTSLRKIGNNLLDKPIEAFTGTKEVFLQGTKIDQNISIKSKRPFGQTITGLIVKLRTGHPA